MPALKRLEINYFEGINSIVSYNLAQKQELRYTENARSKTIGSIEKREGYAQLGADITMIANYGMFFFSNSGTNNLGMYRVGAIAGPTRSVYYLLNVGGVATWTALVGLGTGLSAANCSFTTAENCLFFVNGTDNNKYVTSDGTTVVDSSTATGHLYNSPKAFRINYYKDRLYVGDYYVGAVRFKTGVMRSSNPVGIVALVDGDHPIPGSALPLTSIKVTDTKYIYPSDTLQIYRGGTLIYATLGDATSQFDITNPAGTTFRYTWDGTGTDPAIVTNISTGAQLTIAAQNFNANNNGAVTITGVGVNYFEVTNAAGVVESNKTIGTGSIHIDTITVSAKTEYQLTITSFNTALKSADEVWVNGTRSGAKVFRWANSPSMGIPVTQYDTFNLAAVGGDQITMMTNIGDVQLISNKNSIAAWDDYKLQYIDVGIGCVSDKGYVKHLGALFFVHYTGIYINIGEGQSKLISSKMDEYFRGATTAGLNASVMGKKDKSVLAYIGDVTLYNKDGSTYKTLSDVVLEYDLRQQNWYVHTGIKVTDFKTYVSSTDPDKLIFTHSTNFNTYEFLSGTSDYDSSVANREIPFSIATPEIVLCSQFENFAYPKTIIIEAEGGNAIRCFISLDGAQPYEIKGEARKGCTILKVTPPADEETTVRCRKIRIFIKEYSKGYCKITSMAILYSETEEVQEYAQ